jgi:CheY-like chemotaxis protein
MLKLLLVEDDKIISSIYHRKFADDGFEVTLCENGRDAINHFEQSQPDVVILDLNLPVLNGFEVLRHIRSQPAGENLPVVVFSNAYQPKLIDEAWQSGASAVLMKATTNPRKMAETIHDLLVSVPGKVVKPAQAPGGSPASATRLDGLVPFISGFTKVHNDFLTASAPTTQLSALFELSRAANGLAGFAAAAGLDGLARVAEAFQALLQELHDHPAAVTPSTRRTCRVAMDAVTRLAAAGAVFSPNSAPPAVLLADGNDLSSRLANFAFQKAGITVTRIDHADAVLQSAASPRFDLIVVDSDINGLTAVNCIRQLRETLRVETPIVVVVSPHEFPHQLTQVESMRADPIAKPYTAAELAALTLSLIHRRRLSLPQT